mmetsp:Transcript_42214/g.108707  ORF Transcript_42214/g.108707 Transcript_42214/m.108707 type:complete len:122 (-) Transcript_42214:2289-2654(-)
MCVQYKHKHKNYNSHLAWLVGGCGSPLLCTRVGIEGAEGPHPSVARRKARAKRSSAPFAVGDVGGRYRLRKAFSSASASFRRDNIREVKSLLPLSGKARLFTKRSHIFAANVEVIEEDRSK